MKDSDYRVIPIWFWIVTAVVFGMIFANACIAQQARPTYNPFNNGGMMMQQPQFNNWMQHQRPQFNNWMQYQRPQFNNGFQNNFQQQFNNGFQQSQQTNNIPLFTRRFHLNNGYLFGRPTLYYDPKSNKMQPWVRKNLR